MLNDAELSALAEEALLWRPVAESTEDAYRFRLGVYFTWCRDHGIDPLTPTGVQLQRFKKAYHPAPWGESAMSVAGSALRRLFDYAVETGRLQESPMDGLEWPTSRRDPSALEYLSLDEARTVLATAHRISDAHAITVGLALVNGLAVKELMAANLADVDEHDGTEPSLIVKGRASWHRTPIAPFTMGAIRRHRGDRTEGPLILNGDGNRLNQTNIRRYIERSLKLAKVRKITPTQLAQTGAVLALRHGAIPADVLRLMGHTNIRDMGRYVQSAGLQADLQPAARLADVLVGTRYATLDQARRLLRDTEMEPAAAAMLAGAVLEERLRELCARHGARPRSADPRKWTIDKLKNALHDRGALSADQNIAVNQMALVRNDAAHGRFGQVTRERARDLIRDVRRFLRETEESPDEFDRPWLLPPD